MSAAYVPAPAQTDAVASARAAALGVGIAPRTVPPVYQSIVTVVPGILLDYGSGGLAYIVDDGSPTSGSVASVIAPLQAAQTAAATAAQTAVTNFQAILQAIATALANNATYLGIGSPTGVQVAAQVTALTHQVDGLMRMLSQNLGATT